MAHYKYLIVGGGMTADAAVHGIRQVDGEGTIGLISADREAPYNRPPLSKGLWKGRPEAKIWRGTAGQGVDLFLGCQAMALNPQAKSVAAGDGVIYTFDKLLLATGGSPRHLPLGADEIIYFRTIEDYRHLRALADRSGQFVVIGSGFIGSEIAAALSSVGKQVTMVFPDDVIGSRIFPQDLARYVTEYYQHKGVRTLNGHTVTGVERHDLAVSVHVRETGAASTDQALQADGVVAGLGIEPNVGLARAAGLPVENGIVVDEGLHAGHPDIFAAGDVANFYNPALDRRMRVEHEDNANQMGLLAGQAMAGQPVRYEHLPFFYSDLFDLGYEAVGELDSRLETVSDWQEPMHKGVIYYLREDRVRGVLLWNVWGQIDAARALIATPGSYNAGNLKGRLGSG